MRDRVALTLALLAAVALTACTGKAGPIAGQGPAPPVATPLASVPASLEPIVTQLGAAVAGAGYRLDRPVDAYRPSEPPALADAPRIVLRASLADPDQGLVVVYLLPDIGSAQAAAADMARHVGSGFGQTNFPADAQFHVAHEDDAVIFTWWSPAAASDDEAARAVFEALATVGTEDAVVK